MSKPNSIGRWIHGVAKVFAFDTHLVQRFVRVQVAPGSLFELMLQRGQHGNGQLTQRHRLARAIDRIA